MSDDNPSVGLDEDGRSLNQFNGVDRIVSAADAELEDGREVALVAVVGLVAAAGAGELAGFTIFMTAPAMRSEPAEELLYYGRRDLLHGASCQAQAWFVAVCSSLIH